MHNSINLRGEEGGRFLSTFKLLPSLKRPGRTEYLKGLEQAVLASNV